MALPSPRDPEATRAALTGWFSERTGAPVEVSAPTGPPATGFSNETILVDVAVDGGPPQGLVLRVEPSAHTVFPDDRWDVQRRVLAALGGPERGLRIPRLRWHEDDPSVLGSPFMVMDRVDGEAPNDNPPYSMEGWLFDASPEVRRAVWERGLDAMAVIHGADWRGADLADLDPCPDGGSRLTARLDEWEAMLRWAAPDERHAVPEAALAWLRTNQPPDVDDPALCWGDSRLANQLFADRDDADSVHVAAVLDWEMVHVGDPIQDLGWFTWLDRALTSGIGVPRLDGLPSAAETAARWEAATGRDATHHGWAEILAGVGFAIVMVRLDGLLRDLGLFPPDSDFIHTNPAHVALVEALAELDVHPDDLS